jgi:23S rRNA (adenine2503-C2)-methyltransferase
MKNITKLPSSEGNVWKYIFEFENAIAESVLYKYNTFEERTVICCSVQSGCPVGCVFCGTGKKFLRNLTSEEIVEQVTYIINEIQTKEEIDSLNARCKKLQIMFMSMGEPFLNYLNVKKAIKELNNLYPNADLLVSTIGIDEHWDDFINLSTDINKVGLQFSLHASYDVDRDKIIPYKNKLTIREIRDFGIEWHKATGRPVYLNYCVGKNDNREEQYARLKDLFSPIIFNFTFSVICAKDETMKAVANRDYKTIREIMDFFRVDGYNVRMFDPAGQDDIGGGCGQLWYVQKYFNTVIKKGK